jgi:hypothetical protein
MGGRPMVEHQIGSMIEFFGERPHAAAAPDGS